MLTRNASPSPPGSRRSRALAARPPPPPPRPVLPLRTLRLYETGVGYFERSGTLSGTAPRCRSRRATSTTPSRPSSSSAPTARAPCTASSSDSSISRGMARALAGLPVDGDEPLGLQQLLVGLKGARVEVQARGATTRDASSTWWSRRTTWRRRMPRRRRRRRATTRAPPGARQGEGADAARADRSRRHRPRPGRRRGLGAPLDPGYATRLGSALDALSTRGAQSERLLHVLAHAGGAGPITLGYVAETPVWRTTYRLVLDGAGKSGVLQGWALLHNDTDEDWHGVRVELANGRPDSFLFPLAAPRYARRPLVTPDDQLATVPQLMGTTVDAIWGDQLGDSFGAGGLGLSGVGEGGGGSGEGIGLGRSAPSGTARAPGAARCSTWATSPAPRPAPGVESGALFVYTLPARRSDLRAHDSTLVPFAQQRVDATAIAWVDSPGAAARSAVRFVNSTSQTLPAGTLAFFADGGFAGESALARLKPGERRFLTYGADLDVELRSEDAAATRSRSASPGTRGAAPPGALPPDERLHLRNREPERPPPLGRPGDVARPQRDAHRPERGKLDTATSPPRRLRRRAPQEPRAHGARRRGARPDDGVRR